MKNLINSKLTEITKMKPFLLTILSTVIILLNCLNESFCQNISNNEKDINQTWQAETQNSISKDEYNISFDENINSYQSPNRNNNTRFIYHNDGFTARVRQTKIPLFNERNLEITESEKIFKNIEDWQVKFHVGEFTKSGFRDKDKIRYFNGDNLIVSSNKAQIENGDMRIDYENTKEGMRQDFTIKQKPTGKDILKLAVSVETNLKMRISKERIIFLNKSGEEMMNYASLKVYDANGKILEAIFKKSNNNKNQFLICVNDKDAQYPIVIDPLSSTPTWIAESDQTEANYGFSVASAGDVNGDGYGDVIIGAPFFDNGETDEGRAYVYYGSSTGLTLTPDWTAEGDQPGAFKDGVLPLQVMLMVMA